MIRVGIAMVTAVCTALPAFADPSNFCDALSALQVAAAAPDGSEIMEFPDAGQSQVACRPALELGGIRSLSCNWSYPYRASEAQAAFQTLSAAITACIGEPITQGAPVNHPDTYDLLGFEGGVSAALKDKANLGQTLVILRVQG